MMVTSLTSAVAFLSCFISPIMPIKSYSIFATITVLICFGMTIFIQPLNYYIYEKHILCSTVAQVDSDPQVEDDSSIYVQTKKSRFFTNLSIVIHKLRFPILILGLVIGYLNVRSMTLIKPESENGAVLKESNPLEKLLTWHNKELWRDDN